MRIRKKGYPELNFDGGSFDDAQAAAARIEAERRTGRHKGYEVERSILESFLTDLGGEYAERVQVRKRERALARVAGTKKKPRILPPRHKPRGKTVIAWLLLPLAQIKPTAINDYICDRLADIESPTADREIGLLSQVTTWAMKTVRIELHRSPLYGVKRPSYFNERSRLLKGDEEQRLLHSAREEDRRLAPEMKLDSYRAQVAAIPGEEEKLNEVLEVGDHRSCDGTGGDLIAQTPQAPLARALVHIGLHMQQLRKFRLLQAKLRAQLLDRKRLDVKLSKVRALTARNLVHLLHALDELGKKRLVHV